MERNQIELVSALVHPSEESDVIGQLLEKARSVGVSWEDAKRIKRFLRAHPDSSHTQIARGDWLYSPHDGEVDGKDWRWTVAPWSRNQLYQHWGDQMDRIGDWAGN